mgnify:CR=1 FL=1
MGGRANDVEVASGGMRILSSARDARITRIPKEGRGGR